jgi:hypothetical protein
MAPYLLRQVSNGGTTATNGFVLRPGAGQVIPGAGLTLKVGSEQSCAHPNPGTTPREHLSWVTLVRKSVGATDGLEST